MCEFLDIATSGQLYCVKGVVEAQFDAEIKINLMVSRF